MCQAECQDAKPHSLRLQWRMSAEKQDFYYLRLSKEDGDIEEGSAEESCSVISQRDCIKWLLLKHCFQADEFEEIADDGYYGTSMDRPGMRRLLAYFPCKSSLVAIKYKHRIWPAIPAIGCGKQEVGYVQK